MIASDFFCNKIKDNCFSGLNLIDEIDLEEDFNCNTSGRWAETKESMRKESIAEYVINLNKEISKISLNELEIRSIISDDEFEANLEQDIFRFSGTSFEDLRIFTSNIVGSINFNSCQFNINCRFGNQFLQYMIASASGFIELEKMGTISKDIGLGEWILIYYWKLQLKKAFALGLYKTYESRHDNISTIRGSIDLNSYIRKSYFNGKTNCIFKEHSYSNEINQVIDKALKKTFNSKYQVIVEDIAEIKRTYSELNLLPAKNQFNYNRKVKNPYFKKYNEVYDLSLRIINNKFMNVGGDSNFSAFLFDISLIFEHHIRKLLKQKFILRQKNYKEFTVPNGIYENNIYPDIIIHNSEKKISIYDVKYKHFNNKDGVSREDKYQLISYISCYMNKYEVIECGFIHPCSELEIAEKKNKLQMLKINNKEIPFYIRFYPVATDVKNQNNNDKLFLNEFINDNKNEVKVNHASTTTGIRSKSFHH